MSAQCFAVLNCSNIRTLSIWNVDNKQDGCTQLGVGGTLPACPLTPQEGKRTLGQPCPENQFVIISDAPRGVPEGTGVQAGDKEKGISFLRGIV